MAKKLQLRGGTTAEHSTFTGAVREVTVDTDKKTLVVHDGITVGGFPLDKEAVIIKPTITAPINGTTDFIGEVVASAYETSENYNGSQDVAYWEASTTSDFSNIVDSSSVGNLTTWTPSIGLPLTTIYVRVRYGSDNHLSLWSDTINFVTPNVTISAPTVAVQDAPSDVPEAPILIGSAFTVIGGSDTHESTDWQVVKTSDSSVVWESLADTVNKTEIQVPAGILLESTEYSFKVRYNGATYTGSYGSTTATTTDSFEIDPSIIGTKEVFNSGSTNYISVTRLTDTQALVTYQDNGNSSYGTACVLTINGTSITAGSEVVFNSGSTNYISVTRLTDTQALVTYRDDGNSYYGTACVLTINGTSITASSEVVFNSGI